MKKVEDIFSDYPCAALWRLLIHGYRQKDGPEAFEREEPGYLGSMYKAFDYLLSTVDEPLSVEYLVRLHDLAVSNTCYRLRGIDDEMVISEFFEPVPQGLRDGYGVEFGLVANGDGQNITLLGLRELVQKYEDEDEYFAVLNKDSFAVISKYTAGATLLAAMGNQHHCISIKRTTKQYLEERIKRIIAQYQHALLLASSTDEKLRAIVVCVHELELTHPFPDGNCRTLVVLLLNKLLMQEGFTPAILKSPDYFDAFSIGELCQEVEMGMRRFKNIKDLSYTGDQPLIYLTGNSVVSRLVNLNFSRCFMLTWLRNLRQSSRIGLLASNLERMYIETFRRVQGHLAIDKGKIELYHAGKISESDIRPVLLAHHNALKRIPLLTIELSYFLIKDFAMWQQPALLGCTNGENIDCLNLLVRSLYLCLEDKTTAILSSSRPIGFSVQDAITGIVGRWARGELVSREDDKISLNFPELLGFLLEQHCSETAGRPNVERDGGFFTHVRVVGTVQRLTEGLSEMMQTNIKEHIMDFVSRSCEELGFRISRGPVPE